jgi:hypothetical protein
MLAAVIYRFGEFERPGREPNCAQAGLSARWNPRSSHCSRTSSRTVIASCQDELLERVMGASSDAAISSRIKSGGRRSATDGTQRFIRTVHGQGFRLVVPVKALQAESVIESNAAAAAGPRPCVPRR